MTRLAGVISFEFHDADDAVTTYYGSIAVTMDMEIEELEEATEDSYDFRSYFPGAISWRATTQNNEVVASDGTRNAAQAAIETQAQSRAVFAVTFTSLAGVSYAGSAWVRSIGLESGDQQVLTMAYEFVGVGELLFDVAYLIDDADYGLLDDDDVVLYAKSGTP